MGYALKKLYPEAINTGIYTFKDYLKLPEGSPYQLIEGELIMSPSPTSYHQTVSKNLEFILIGHVKANKSGVIFDAPIDVYLDEKNVYVPDIIFISNENKSIIRKKGIVGAPDLVIEILSVSTMGYDEIVKKNVYLEAGVKEYITVNPSEKIIKTYIDRKYLKSEAERSGKDLQIIETDASISDEMFINVLNLHVPLKEVFEPDSEYQLRDDDKDVR